MKRRARSLIFAIGATVLGSNALSLAAYAQALQSYVLENVKSASSDKSSEVFIPRIEIVGANVTRADIERLLSPDLRPEQRAELMMNIQAQRILVPEIVVTRTDKDKARFVFRDYQITNLDRARFDRISLGGAEGKMTTSDKNDGTFSSGPMSLEGGDFSKVAAAAKAGSASDGVAKLRAFTWSGFELTVTDSALAPTAAGGNAYRIALKSVNAKTDYAGDVPTKALARFGGMSFSAPPASDVGKALANFGYDRIEFDLNFEGAYNPASRSFSLADYSITGLKAGSISISGSFAEIDGSAFTAGSQARLASLMKGKIADVNLNYVDAGLFEKALAFYAASQGKDATSVRQEWGMMIVGLLPMLMGGDPAALKLSEALSTFINKPKSLSISLTGKAGAIGMADLMKLADPAAFLSKVEIKAVANR